MGLHNALCGKTRTLEPPLALALYKPPNAKVGDPPEVSLPRPASVRLAVTCLWLSAAIAVALELWSMFKGPYITLNPMDLAIAAVTAALFAFVATRLGAGRGWARWLFVVFYGIGLVIYLAVMLLQPELLAIVTASEIVQLALQTTALISMFTRGTRQWLRAMRSARSSRAS